MQSNSRMFNETLKNLDRWVNIFEDKDVLAIDIISKIKKHEKGDFLPKPVRGVFEFMLRRFNQVQKLAKTSHVPAQKFVGKEP